MSEDRLEIIKENVYMRSEIAKISRIGIDTSLKEELELIEEIDRLNNIIKDLQQKVEQLENIRKEIKEHIEKNVVCCKNSDMLVELNVDDLLKILNK